MAHMYGPAVRRKRVSSICRPFGLASMYPASDWSMCSGPYQRACVLISGQASIGPCGPPVFACAGKTGPPSRFILSQTSAGNDVGAMSSLGPHRCSSFVRAMRPFLRSLIAATNASAFFPLCFPPCFGAFFCSTAPQAFFRPDRNALLTQIGTPSHLSSHTRICIPC
jgi:hypothetical protein